MTKSSKSNNQLFGCLLLILLGSVILVHMQDRLPDWMELRIERPQVWKRVQNAGGWTALQRDCNALATKYNDGFGFTWSRDMSPGDTNSLPPAIAALNPQKVVYFSPTMMQQHGGVVGDNRYGTNLVVRISIFKQHNTGMHEKPRLGVDVLCGSSVTNYSPVSPHPSASMGTWNWQYRKIVDGIYERYCIMN